MNRGSGGQTNPCADERVLLLQNEKDICTEHGTLGLFRACSRPHPVRKPDVVLWRNDIGIR